MKAHWCVCIFREKEHGLKGATEPARPDLLRNHLKSFWPDRKLEEFVWPIGPIRRVLPEFRVCRVAPNDPSTEGWVYVSIGASEIQLDEYRAEFFFHSS